MAVKQKNTTIEKIKKLLETGQKSKLRDFLNDQFSQDIAEVLKGLGAKDQLTCFMLLDLEHAGEVLAEVNPETQLNLIKILGSRQLAPIVAQMEVDDATDLVVHLPEEEKAALLKVLPDPIQQAHVQELIHYPPESAGGIMSTDFLRLRSDMTIQLALNYVRRQAAEYKVQIHYLYVVDNANQLVGVISLRNLISAPSGDLVANHMSTDVITCKVTDDQETVAKTISKYDLIALPITDEKNMLKGIVTIDDVVDILNKETTEDIYQSSGISDVVQSDNLISGKVSYAIRARLPWLLITLFGEALAAFIIAAHDKTITSAPIAISFMPLLSGLSGNIGGQTVTIVVRGLVTGEIDLKNTFKHVFHEFQIGLLVGGICAIVTGLVAWYYHNLPALGLVVAFALTFSMTIAAMVGAIFPILLQYFRKDPACASSPVITTLLDILTFTFYLFIISASLRYLK